MTSSIPPDYYIPEFITVTRVSADRDDRSHTISNGSSGRHFAANATTAAFLEAIARKGTVPAAARAAGIDATTAKQLTERLLEQGVVVERGQTQKPAPKPKPPFESRAISLRADLFDAEPFIDRIGWLGPLLFSRLGFGLWTLLMVAALTQVLRNQDKARYALSQVAETGPFAALTFLTLLIGLKAVHEIGHGLAYRRFCRREDLDPGPIRMGIAVFAMTPFPFTDVTGAWRLRDRRARAIIGLGGLYLEFWAVGLLTLLWAETQASAFQAVVFQTVVFASVSSVLFNLNPAVKLDGYYVLSDLLNLTNLSGKATQAARIAFARLFGANVARPAGGYLGYWTASYAYRWVIFAGVFWLAYQADPRLAVPVAIAVILMLVLRPIAASLTFARANGASPMRLITFCAALAILAACAFVPFRDRILLEGQASRFDTTFLRSPEHAQLSAREGPGLNLHSHELSFRRADLALRHETTATALRAARTSGAEQARLETDLAQIGSMLRETDARIAALDMPVPTDALWTDLDARRLRGAQVQPGATEPLAAISNPTALQLTLWLPQSRFETGLLDQADTAILVRPTATPFCTFAAKITDRAQAVSEGASALRLQAQPVEPLPTCAETLSNGAAVVARLDTSPKNLAQRAQRRLARTLQDRLPVEALTGPPQR